MALTSDKLVRAKKFTEPATIIVKWKGRIENFIANCEENRGAVSTYNKNRSKKAKE